MPADEVIARYHDLWRLQPSFRMPKSDFRARGGSPYVRRDRGLTPSHHDDRTGRGQVIKQLRPPWSATITVNGSSETFSPSQHPNEQNLADLNVPPPGR